MRAMLRSQHEQLLRHDPGVRVGGEPEDVHDMRVAVRRSRADARSGVGRPSARRAVAGEVALRHGTGIGFCGSVGRAASFRRANGREVLGDLERRTLRRRTQWSRISFARVRW